MAKDKDNKVTPETAAAHAAASPEQIEEDAQRRKAAGIPYEQARKLAVRQSEKALAGPAWKKGGKR